VPTETRSAGRSPGPRTSSRPCRGRLVTGILVVSSPAQVMIGAVVAVIALVIQLSVLRLRLACRSGRMRRTALMRSDDRGSPMSHAASWLYRELSGLLRIDELPDLAIEILETAAVDRRLSMIGHGLPPAAMAFATVSSSSCSLSATGRSRTLRWRRPGGSRRRRSPGTGPGRPASDRCPGQRSCTRSPRRRAQG
jgi:hypothetical protein